MARGQVARGEAPASFTREAGRRLPAQPADQVRLVGRDGRHQLRAAGFRPEEAPAGVAEAARLDLMHGESVLVARRGAL